MSEAHPSATMPRPSATPGGVNLENFHILRNLGEGGMGMVYLAYDPENGRRVALKILADHLADERLHVERFYREARISASFEHPNIVRTLNFGRDVATGRNAMVLEFVDGPSCQYLIDRDGKLSVDDAVLIIYHVAKALEHLHAHRIVHRDVKPDNILIGSDGVARLADFGLAKQMGGPDDLTAHASGFGTSWYMPYEQARNAGFVDERSDLFSLGATFYHLLTGQVPFPGENHAEVVAKKQTDRFQPVSRVNPSLPPTLDPILKKLLALDPRKRYASARELIIDLERSRLLNGYRTTVAVMRGAFPFDRSSHGAPTSPDLKLNDATVDTPIDTPWHLQCVDADGRVYSRRATTRQVLDGLRAGVWPPDTEAARAERRQFRPLREYPEFRPAIEALDLANSEANPGKPLQRSFRKIYILAGVGIGMLVAATVIALAKFIFG